MDSNLKSKARHKAIDYLSRRDHTPKELKTKLKKFFAPDLIDEVLQELTELSYLPVSEEEWLRAAQNRAQVDHRKLLGQARINLNLKKKGLPPLQMDQSLEREKALDFIAKKKIETRQALTRAERARLFRQLLSRGFSMDIVRQVLASFPSKGHGDEDLEPHSDTE